MQLDDEDETLEQLDMLIDFLERREVPFKEFEESAFESIVEKIVVSNNIELSFHMLGGLVLKETI